MGLRTINVVTCFLIVFAGALSAAAAQAQVKCKLTLRSDPTYPVLLEFSEVVTGLTKRDFTVDGGVVEELVALVGNTSALRSALVRPTRRGTVWSSRMRVSLPANSVVGRASKAYNTGCGPLSYTVQDPPPKSSPTSTPTGTPTDIAATQTPEPTATAVLTVTVPETATPGPIATSTPEATPTLQPTMQPTAQPTVQPTLQPTVQPTLPFTATPSASPTPLSTTTPQPTRTATRVATSTPVTPATQSPGVSPVCSEIAQVTPSVLAFPGAIGHGRFSVGGSGRHLQIPCTRIYTVTNRNDSGAGSLRECVEARGPRTCVFAVGGQFWATKEIKVLNPYLTIAGQTAPLPGVNIRGATLSIEASEVIVQGVRMRVGDDPRADCCKSSSCSAAVALTCTSDPGSRDGIRVYAARAPIRNIILDHVSISWALDEGFSVSAEKGDVTNVTFSNSIIGAGLDMSNHPEASSISDPGHSKGVLIGGAFSVNGLSFIGNYLAHNADRNIRASTALSLEFMNNIVFDWGRGRGAGRAIELTNTKSAVHAIDLVSNVYIPGKDTFCPETEYRPDLCFEKGADGIDSEAERRRLHYILRVGNGTASGLSPLSRYFLVDNIGPTRPNSAADEWDVADRTFYSSSSGLLYSSNDASSPVASSGSYFPVSTTRLLEAVLPSVGARPLERDSVDSRLVLDVQLGNGRIINCVAADGTERCAKNAGGWPNYNEIFSPVSLPQRYAEDLNQNGYTDLEDTLVEYSSKLGE